MGIRTLIMSPRGRTRKNHDLPQNLKVLNNQSGTYYFYVFPDGRCKSLGKNKQEAIQLTNELNLALSVNKDKLSSLLNHHKNAPEKTKSPPFDWAVKDFTEKRLSLKTISERTRKETDYKLRQYIEFFGTTNVHKIEHSQIVSFLNDKTPHTYVKHRILLSQLWEYFVHQAWADKNHPENTMRAIMPKKVRQRHSLDKLMAIRAICPDYMQRAIDIALHSIQRLGDQVLLHRDIVDLEANTLTVLQQKSRNYAKPVYIKIYMHPELRAAVDACLSTGIPCPYLLHYRPARMTAEIRAAKNHPFAMTEKFVTKQFQKFRDESGVYDDLEIGERPSWHDIRALGELLISEKYGHDYAQALAGHSEKMHTHYLSGHGEQQPELVSWR